MDTKAMSRRIRDLMSKGMTRQQALTTIIAGMQLAARELERRKVQYRRKHGRTRT